LSNSYKYFYFMKVSNFRVIDCNNLLPMSLKNGTTDVLNGIAYNPLTKSIYVTGKYWPKMYRIELVEK
ncbi:MAG: glutaminyl-peptide cyclotransferase, partial [Bacteroidales bacterium]